MKIFVAKNAGYCSGVRNAIDLAEKTAQKNGEVFMLGEIVHNEMVVENLEKLGAQVVRNLNEIPKKAPVLFRAHGTKKQIWDEAEARKMNIVDATCPLVLEIHDETKKLADEGRKIIVIGDHGHDEVVGIVSQVSDAIVVADADEARNLGKLKKVGVVSQSTQTLENVQKIITVLLEKTVDLRFVNTICYPTRRNQMQISELAEKYDLMIVIGSFTSANSKRLAEISGKINPKTYQVACAEDLKKKWFDGAQTVGIGAGASTPDSIIETVKLKIEELKK